MPPLKYSPGTDRHAEKYTTIHGQKVKVPACTTRRVKNQLKPLPSEAKATSSPRIVPAKMDMEASMRNLKLPRVSEHIHMPSISPGSRTVAEHDEPPRTSRFDRRVGVPPRGPQEQPCTYRRRGHPPLQPQQSSRHRRRKFHGMLLSVPVPQKVQAPPSLIPVLEDCTS